MGSTASSQYAHSIVIDASVGGAVTVQWRNLGAEVEFFVKDISNNFKLRFRSVTKLNFTEQQQGVELVS